MSISDLFVGPMTYVIELRQTPEQWQIPAQQVRDDLVEMLRLSEVVAEREQVSSQAYSLARFAVCAWIDETILESCWNQKDLWLKEQLQRRFYGTSEAGEEFFTRLSALGLEQPEVREVYCLCLALGFSGRYCSDGDRERLDELKAAQLKIMMGSTLPLPLERTQLFPHAYPQDLPHSEKKTRLTHPLAALPAAVAVAAPMALLVVLFLVFRFTLSYVGQNFLRSVPY